MLAGELSKGSLPAIIGPNAVVIRFPASYNRQCQACGEPARLQRIQDALKTVTGEDWSIRFETIEDSQPAGQDSQPLMIPERQPALAENPLITAIKSTLDARVMRVDEGFGQVAERRSSDDESGWSQAEDE